jgi:hypothetical protein
VLGRPMANVLKDPLEVVEQLRAMAQEVDDRPVDEINALLIEAAEVIVVLRRVAMLAASAIADELDGADMPGGKPH